MLFMVVLTVLHFAEPEDYLGRFRSIQGGACHFDYSYPALYFYLRHKKKHTLASAQLQLAFILKTNSKLTKWQPYKLFCEWVIVHVNQSSFMEALNSGAGQATFRQIKMGWDLVGLEQRTEGKSRVMLWLRKWLFSFWIRIDPLVELVLSGRRQLLGERLSGISDHPCLSRCWFNSVPIWIITYSSPLSPLLTCK